MVCAIAIIVIAIVTLLKSYCINIMGKKLWLLVSGYENIKTMNDFNDISDVYCYTTRKEALENMDNDDTEYLVEVTINKVEATIKPVEARLQEITLK